MSYDYQITPTEISVSAGALGKLRWDFDLQRGIPEEIIQVLDREFSIHAEVIGYTNDAEPIFHFELVRFVASERLGLRGVIDQLKKNLKYADPQSFELFDENGAYMTYQHPGFGSREEY